MAKRICDICGAVDEAPRHVWSAAAGEVPPVNQAMVAAVLDMADLSTEERAAIVADLHDNTLMIRHHTEDECAALDHLTYVPCTPFGG